MMTAHGRREIRRRGIVAVQVAVMLTVLMGVAALTIDVGQVYSARAELQRSADAAALAGAYAYTTDEMMRIRMGTASDGDLTYVKTLARGTAKNFSKMNETLKAPTIVETGDVRTGNLDLNSATAPINTGAASTDLNAVYVYVQRTEEDSNGAVPLFFSGIFGKFTAESSASAVAVLDDRVTGFQPDAPGASNLLPFTISEEAYAGELAGGGDSYGWDEANDLVTTTGDGIREIRIYPYPLSGSGYTEGDGNFGTLNIGTGHQGVEAERVQILNGVAPSDFEAEIGTSDPTFFDSSGNPITHVMSGSPGLEVTLEATIEQLEGQVVGFFLHSNVDLSGANAQYTITDLRFGRVMDIRLTGNPNQRGFFVQPVTYVGAGVKIDPDAPSTGGMVGLLVLAR